jgi:glycosyltransferase involved in cell wall biosynthesis
MSAPTSGRVLMLTHTAPLPLVSGERVRNFHLLRELVRRGWRASLFSLVHGPSPSPAEEATLREMCETVLFQELDASPLARYRRLARAVATRTAFHAHYFFAPHAARALQAFLSRSAFDAIVAESLYTYPYVPPELHRLLVLDTLNAELRRVEAMAAVLGASPRGLVARAQLGPVRRYERDAAKSVARVIAVSEEERRYFEAYAPGRVDVVPNGVDCDAVSARVDVPRAPHILFVGSMDYSANVDAVEHLVAEVLPRVRRSDATLTIVGSNPRPSVRRAVERSQFRIELAGQVPATDPYFQRSRLLVVPLRFGGGTRLKILESLARGVPVVSTSLGCEGLRLTHEQDAIVADTPEELAAWIDRLLEDDELCLRLSREGRRTVEQHYDWRAIGAQLDQILRRVGEQGRS